MHEIKNVKAEIERQGAIGKSEITCIPPGYCCVPAKLVLDRFAALDAEVTRLKAESVVTIGRYSLSIRENGVPTVYEGKPYVWMEHESGEAMSVEMSWFESFLDKFYKENF